MKIKEAIEYFEMNLWNRNLAESSIIEYKKNLSYFTNFLMEEGIEHIQDVKRFHLEKYNATLVRKGNSPRTRSRKNSINHNFFQYCKTQDFIEKVPTDGLSNIKVTDADQKKREVLTVKELNRFLKVINEKSKHRERNVVMMKIMLFCGLRVSELVSLKWKDIDLKRRIISVQGKGRKERDVPLFKEIEKELAAYKKSQKRKSEYIFSKDGSKPLTTRAVRDLVKRYAKKARIKKVIGPHSLRRTAATNYLLEGMDIKMIQILLGHSNLATTSLYINPDEESINRAFTEAFNNIRRKKKIR